MERTDSFRLVLGLFIVFALFHGSATILGSDRGQRGILIGTLVVAATAAVERFLLHQRNDAVLRQLGLGRPRTAGIVAASGVAVVLWMVALVFVSAREMTFSFYPGWISLLPGLFAQAGIAEEVLFRGYLFRHIRPRQDVLASSRPVDAALRRRSLGALLLHAMADRARIRAPRGRDQLPAGTSLRARWKYDLGACTAALRRSGHGEGRGVFAGSRIVRIGVDGGERDDSAVGLHGESSGAC